MGSAAFTFLGQHRRRWVGGWVGGRPIVSYLSPCLHALPAVQQATARGKNDRDGGLYVLLRMYACEKKRGGSSHPPTHPPTHPLTRKKASAVMGWVIR